MFVSCFLLYVILMRVRPPRLTRSDTLLPDTTLFRSSGVVVAQADRALVQGLPFLVSAPVLTVSTRNDYRFFITSGVCGINNWVGWVRVINTDISASSYTKYS